MTPTRTSRLETRSLHCLILPALACAIFAGTPANAMDQAAGSVAETSSSAHADHEHHAPEGHAHHEHAEHQGQGDGDDPHAHHRSMMNQKGYKRSEHEYRLEDVKLTAMDGSETTLLNELDSGKPVMINFVFTTCTTICPVMSGTFAQVQSQLGPEAEEVRMVSFSIDPEYDTPERLRAYANQYGAGSQWQFLTGDLDALIAVQKAFDVYRGNKMNHEPTTLMRRSPDEPWVRLDGIASGAQIVAEYRQLVQR